MTMTAEEIGVGLDQLAESFRRSREAPEACTECGRTGQRGSEILWCAAHQRWECRAKCFPKG